MQKFAQNCLEIWFTDSSVTEGGIHTKKIGSIYQDFDIFGSTVIKKSQKMNKKYDFFENMKILKKGN